MKKPSPARDGRDRRSKEDRRAIQETLYLISIPGMRESILEGMSTPVEECEEDLWKKVSSWQP